MSKNESQRNEDEPISGFWGMLVAVMSWLAPIGVFTVLRFQFAQDETWKEVGPLLEAAFLVLVVFGEMGALLLAALAWPRRLAKITVPVALFFFVLNAYQLVKLAPQLSGK
jgi:hypothetical protein